MDKNRNTAEVILDAAESIVQEVGFNAFSYAHIAKKIGIRSASIHYHFPNKEDLGEALIKRYHQNFLSISMQIDSSTQDNVEKLRKFILIYRDPPVKEYRTCLSVMLATDLTTLSGGARDELAQFFNSNLAWLERVFDEGRKKDQLHFEGPADVQALQFLTSLQGAQLLTRSFRDLAKFDAISDRLISALTS